MVKVYRMTCKAHQNPRGSGAMLPQENFKTKTVSVSGMQE